MPIYIEKDGSLPMEDGFSIEKVAQYSQLAVEKEKELSVLKMAR